MGTVHLCAWINCFTFTISSGPPATSLARTITIGQAFMSLSLCPCHVGLRSRMPVTPAHARDSFAAFFAAGPSEHSSAAERFSTFASGMSTRVGARYLNLSVIVGAVEGSLRRRGLSVGASPLAQKRCDRCCDRLGQPARRGGKNSTTRLRPNRPAGQLHLPPGGAEDTPAPSLFPRL